MSVHTLVGSNTYRAAGNSDTLSWNLDDIQSTCPATADSCPSSNLLCDPHHDKGVDPSDLLIFCDDWLKALLVGRRCTACEVGKPLLSCRSQ